MTGDKTTKKTPGARIVDSLRGLAESLALGENVQKKYTCRRVVLDLEPQKYGPKEVREVRNRLGASQAIFAKFLGVALGTVRKWESGETEPSPIACRFMDELWHDMQRSKSRLQELVSPRERTVPN